jgi:hypothetical protein
VEPTDFLHGKWYAHMTLAEVLGHDGRLDEAQRAVGDAVRAAEEKGHLVRVELARDLGSRLGTYGA